MKPSGESNLKARKLTQFKGLEHVIHSKKGNLFSSNLLRMEQLREDAHFFVVLEHTFELDANDGRVVVTNDHLDTYHRFFVDYQHVFRRHQPG